MPTEPASTQHPTDIPLKERLIVALDVPNTAQAQALVQRIGDGAIFYKVGLQLFVAEGPGFVRNLVTSGKKVFLDLKFHDIPNTAAGAVKSTAELGISLLTVHAVGGSKMLEAAVEAANQSKNRPKILAVTMLTSISEADMAELRLSGSMADRVLSLADIAKKSGCHGVVSSPREASQIRRAIGSEMLIVTPGIRPSGEAEGDQARIATPADALLAGATHLVVGRPITDNPNPAAAVQAILKQMASA
jgi:orotidine-5'-phosphate decarboxylase